MSKRVRPVKLLPVWIAVSAVVIIAGIILFALLGFNYAAEQPASKTFELKYNVVAVIEEKEDDLQKACEDAFAANGISYSGKTVTNKVDGSYLSETGDVLLQYTFKGDVSSEKLEAAKTAVAEKLAADFANVQTNVDFHVLENESFHEASWRAAVAIAVGAVVVLIYIGIRFGVGCALTGLVACVHDVFFTLALLAIARIPLYAISPLLYAAIAAVVSLLLWMLQSAKMRENFKDPAYTALSAEEAVEESGKTALKPVLAVACTIAAVFVIFGAVAAAGVRTLVLPALIPVAAALYSSLLLAPALHVPVKSAFDRRKASRKQRYTGKKKAEKTEE